MDPVRLGLSIRALRLRLGWRQLDLAERASVSQQTISDIERGRAAFIAPRRLTRVAEALDASLDIVVRWRGGALDRLLDERHAELCGAAARRLRDLGWEVLVEVSYAHFGERGSIDVVGWRGDTAAVVIVEVKSELTSVEATLRKHDEKIRLAPTITRDRLGRSVRTVIRLLVLADDSTTRRRVARHTALLGGSYPLRGHAAWAAVAAASAPAGGLVFLSPTSGRGGSQRSVTRVRARPHAATARHARDAEVRAPQPPPPTRR